jgi:hypothetical protein
LLLLFSSSRLGVAISDSAIPIAVVTLLLAAALLVRYRPTLPWQFLPVLGVCALGLFLAGSPLLDLGFRWLGNGNDDMANFVLGAARLLDVSFSAPLDVDGLARGIDYATLTGLFDVAGARPGASLMLAFVQRLTGLEGYEAFMPLLLAFHLSGMCAVGALALQATRRWWAAVGAGALLALSPLATYGVLQQLMPQVWGLTLGCALAALLMSRDLHSGRGARIGDAVLVGVLFTGLLVTYPELIPTLGLAYVGYLGVLAWRRQLSPRVAVRLWAVGALIGLVLLNTFLPREVEFLREQVVQGTGSSDRRAPLFGYSLTPLALPATVGLESFAPDLRGELGPSIGVAVVALVAAVAVSALGAWGGGAAALVVLVQAGLGVYLYAKRADFGLFKLTMFVQPFLAAAVVAWLANLRRVRWTAVGLAAVGALAVAGASTQREYVDKSRNPIDVRNASSPNQLPAFRRILSASGKRPLLSASDNIVLIKLQAASGDGRRLRFLSRDAFVQRYIFDHSGRGVDDRLREGLEEAQRLPGWQTRRFDLLVPGRDRQATFTDDTVASALLRSGSCMLALPSGTQTVLNRRRMPEGSPDLVGRPCAAARNHLVFTHSSLGQHYYLSDQRPAVSFYQLEPDFFFPGRTMSAFGRHVLFRVLGQSAPVRLALDLTTSFRHDGVNRLPPAVVVGASRARLPLEGRGSARVFSAPLRPQMIAGQPYLMLDMGEDGRFPTTNRRGLLGLYGSEIPLDTRYITAYVRGISLVSDPDYARQRPPAALRSFPGDLANPALEYTGLYEDGWVGESASAVLSADRGAHLAVEGETLSARPLRLLVDGREVARTQLRPGPFRLRVRVPPGTSRRRIQLRFDSVRPLPAPDTRPVAARLTFLGFVKPP